MPSFQVSLHNFAISGVSNQTKPFIMVNIHTVHFLVTDFINYSLKYAKQRYSILLIYNMLTEQGFIFRGDGGNKDHSNTPPPLLEFSPLFFSCCLHFDFSLKSFRFCQTQPSPGPSWAAQHFNQIRVRAIHHSTTVQQSIIPAGWAKPVRLSYFLHIKTNGQGPSEN